MSYMLSNFKPLNTLTAIQHARKTYEITSTQDSSVKQNTLFTIMTSVIIGNMALVAVHNGMLSIRTETLG
jgi:hypothetical protein